MSLPLHCHDRRRDGGPGRERRRGRRRGPGLMRRRRGRRRTRSSVPFSLLLPLLLLVAASQQEEAAAAAAASAMLANHFGTAPAALRNPAASSFRRSLLGAAAAAAATAEASAAEGEFSSDGGDDDEESGGDDEEEVVEIRALRPLTASAKEHLKNLAAAASSEETTAANNRVDTDRTRLRAELRRYRSARAAEGDGHWRGGNNYKSNGGGGRSGSGGGGASAAAVPAYAVFTDAVLEGILSSLPATREELLEVKGIGPKKLELYGDDVLRIVAGCASGKADGAKAAPGRSRQATAAAAASLTPEQLEAAKVVLQDHRRNAFITGSAGTGKSHVLRYVVGELRNSRRRGGGRGQGNGGGAAGRVGVCAPTGVAAVHAGGSTLHSYFGIGLPGPGSSVGSLVRRIGNNRDARRRVDETDVLVVDECSMLDSGLLELLDGVARECRQGGKFRDRPFGGMRLILFGDFFQLPPIHRNGGGGGDRDRTWRPFAFESPVWSSLGLDGSVVELKGALRQADDDDFVRFLDKVRVGDVSVGDVEALNARCCISERHPLPDDGIVPTRLYALNRDVDAENESRLAALPGDAVVCEAVDRWRERMPPGTSAATKRRMKDALDQELPREVALKVGAQVMLTRNKDLDKGLANGSRGVVERFVPGAGGGQVPVVRFDCGVTTEVPCVEAVRANPDGGDGRIVRMQVPLKLAWALTIHKSQGATLTRALLDVSRTFEYGQCYVALSRVRNLDGLWLEKPARPHNIMVSPQVLDFFDRTSRT